MQPEHKDPALSPFSRRAFLKGSAAVAVATGLTAPFVHAAETDKIRVGLVGCGGRGKGAAGNCVAAAPNVQVTAVGDLFPDVAEETFAIFSERPKDKYNVTRDRVFSGWDAYKGVINADQVDLVILATPPGFRPMMIEAAIAAGKHVFAEKPVAVDSAGVRKIIAAAEVANQKGLGIVGGTQRRHDRGYMETIKRIHDGMIGDVLAGQVYWMQGGLWTKPRQPDWSDMEWQLRNWLYFTWLSGDHIVEQHMHQHDVANWVMGGPPKYCLAMGGRIARTDPQFGHIYDHFAVDYEYPNGAHVLSMCRQIDGTAGRVAEWFVGCKGKAFAEGRIEIYGNRAAGWRHEIPEEAAEEEINPYVLEHTDLINSIRAGKPLNEGKQVAESTLTAIMGRMAAYSGKLVTFQAALNANEDLFPKKLEFGPMPVPPVAIPGKVAG